jgi:hypothetical protein
VPFWKQNILLSDRIIDACEEILGRDQNYNACPNLQMHGGIPEITIHTHFVKEEFAKGNFILYSKRVTALRKQQRIT